MKKIIILLFSLFLSTSLLAAGSDSSSSGSSEESLYDDAVKLVKRAGKLEKKEKLDKAKKLYVQAFSKLEKAYKSDKKNPDILNYMGFTTRKVGNFEQAEKFYLDKIPPKDSKVSMCKNKISDFKNKINEDDIFPKKKWFKKFDKYWTPNEENALKELRVFIDIFKI